MLSLIPMVLILLLSMLCLILILLARLALRIDVGLRIGIMSHHGFEGRPERFDAAKLVAHSDDAFETAV